MSKRSASRCPSASTSRPILIIGVTTSDRANEVAYFDRTWAASVPARAVADTVWYTDSWRTPMPRCAHILPKATDVLTRRVQILDDVYARYRHHLWYVVVEDDAGGANDAACRRGDADAFVRPGGHVRLP